MEYDVTYALSFQGVNLSNIIKEVVNDNSPATSTSKLTASLDNISKLIKKPTGNEESVIEELQALKYECDKSIAHRVLAGSLGTYNVLLDVLELFQSVDEVSTEALSAMSALMSGNPDLLDSRGIEIMISYLDHARNVDVQGKVLEWVKVCCIMHEHNRQEIFRTKIVTSLKNLLDIGAAPVIVRFVCGVARALVLDDDVRVEFGKAHEHARNLAAEILCPLLDLLKSKLLLFWCVINFGGHETCVSH
jgi:hypothetical protein